MNSFSFEPKDHIYTLNGRKLPSVSEILSAVNYTDFSGPWFTEAAKDSGSNLHECCALIDENDLDYDSVDPRIIHEVMAYDKWKRESGFVCLFTEKPMYSERYNIAGTGDTYGYFGDRISPSDYALIDRKRGAVSKGTRFQLAMYAILIGESIAKGDFKGMAEYVSPLAIKRYAFGNIKNKPTIIQYEDPNDIRTAKSIIAVYHAGVNAGIYK